MSELQVCERFDLIWVWVCEEIVGDDGRYCISDFRSFLFFSFLFLAIVRPLPILFHGEGWGGGFIVC